MKKNLLRSAAAIAVLAGGSAYAADLPVYTAPVAPAPIVDVAAYTFTGPWIGVQAGAVFGGHLDDLFDDDEDFFDFDDGDDDTTWELGIAAGYDWQMGSFVLGVLGDVNWVHDFDRSGGFTSEYEVFVTGAPAAESAIQAIPDGGTAAGVAPTIGGALAGLGSDFGPGDGSGGETIIDTIALDPLDAGSDDDDNIVINLDFEDGLVTDTATYSESLDWYATARVRAGFAVGRAMFYGTGGLSYGAVDTFASFTRTYDADAVDAIYGRNDVGAIDPSATETEIEADIEAIDSYDPATDGALPDGCTYDAIGGGATCSVSGGDDDDRFGYALGAGVEVLATQNVSIGLEYLYVNLGSGDDIEIVVDGDGLEYDDIESDDFDFHTVKLRAAYRF